MTRALGAVLVISWVLMGLPEVTGLDVWVHDGLPRPEWLRTTAFVVGLVLGPTIGWSFAAVLFVLAWRRREPRLWKALALHGLCCATLLTRWLFDRMRPIEYHLPSYPSGHTVAVASTAFTLVVLLRRGVPVGGARGGGLGLRAGRAGDALGHRCGRRGAGCDGCRALGRLALGLVTSGRELVPHLARPRRRP